ncbi:MAG: hypothetical protein KGY56_14795 [Desulfobacterales bacterium]|nr:hypothetical protein [Desulfobacterales bacterium]
MGGKRKKQIGPIKVYDLRAECHCAIRPDSNVNFRLEHIGRFKLQFRGCPGMLSEQGMMQLQVQRKRPHLQHYLKFRFVGLHWRMGGRRDSNPNRLKDLPQHCRFFLLFSVVLVF